MEMHDNALLGMLNLELHPLLLSCTDISLSDLSLPNWAERLPAIK